MDVILERFHARAWTYAEGDPRAVAELERRIASTGRAGGFITYSDLARSVSFDLPNLHESPRTIDVLNWQQLDRAIIGDFLNYVSMRSYELAEFFSSALVVTKMDGTPGDGFNVLLKDLGLIRALSSEEALEIWVENVKKAQAWYKRHA